MHSSFITSGTHYSCVITGSFSIPGLNLLQVARALNVYTRYPVILPKAAQYNTGFPHITVLFFFF